MTKDELLKSAKEIPGYSGYWITKDGNLYSTRSGQLVEIKTRLSQSGYISATVTSNDFKRTSLGIHRLLAMAYLEKQEGQTEVNHKDGDKFNNDLSNLEWCSHSENEKHKVHSFMTERARPVRAEHKITHNVIWLPSSREADRFLNASVNTVSKLLHNADNAEYGDYILSYLV